MSKWDQRGIDLARLVASWSKDPSTKVGAANLIWQALRLKGG